MRTTARVALFLAAILAGWILAHAAQRAERPVIEYRARLDRVIDGDTAVLWVEHSPHIWRKHRCRLARIDAPELRDPGGEEARAALRDLLEHAPLRLRYLGLEKYRRWLVELEADRKNVSDELVRIGHAKPWGPEGSRR